MKGIEIVTEFLGKVTYPINKRKLVEAAHNFRMDDDIVQTVEALPNKAFASLEDVIPYVRRQNAAAVVGGVRQNVGNAIRGARETSGKVRESANRRIFMPEHPESDTPVKTRQKPSQTEGEREFDDHRGVYRMSDDEGRSQST